MPRPAPRHFEIEDEPTGFGAAALGVAMRRPVDTLACVLAAACVVMIFVNALALQKGRAPVVGPAKATSASATTAAPEADAGVETPKRDELVVQVQTALAERDRYSGVVDGVMGPETAAAIRGFEQAQGLAPTGEASEKVLAALLTAPMRKVDAKTSTPARSAPAPVQQPAVTGSTASNPKLMAAQKALARIGYGPVSIDGKMGTETRNAIKSFERDRGMPETGELSPQVARALQQLTGAPLH